MAFPKDATLKLWTIMDWFRRAKPAAVSCECGNHYFAALMGHKGNVTVDYEILFPTMTDAGNHALGAIADTVNNLSKQIIDMSINLHGYNQ